MRIGVDARRLTHGRLDGRLSYLRNGMQNILRLDDKNEYVFFVDGPLQVPQAFSKGNVTFYRLPYRFKYLDTVANDWWRFRSVPRPHNLSGFHLIVDPYPKLDLPYVISANDLTVYKSHHRGQLPLGSFLWITAWRQYNKLSFSDVAKRARRIHCITHVMKREFQEYLGISQDKLRVIYPGGDNEHFSVIEDLDSLTEFRRTIGVRHEYIMAFGNKNLCVLLEAYSKLPKALRDQFKLVITGLTFQTPTALDSITSRLGIAHDVHFFNYQIPHEKLLWFYNAAALFVLPTQYEMFCNMIIEAMSCKCPVLASKLEANVELGSTSIAYYDGINDAEDLSAAMCRLLGSKSNRDELAEAGRARGGMFTWENYARQILELYVEAFS